MSQNNNWYYSQDQNQYGPVTQEVIGDLIKVGAINTATLVWRQGMDDWHPLSSCPDLTDSSTANQKPPPLPAHFRHNNLQSADSSVAIHDESVLSSSPPSAKKLFTVSLIAGALSGYFEGETYSLANFIGYAIGAALGLIALTYILAIVPIAIYWLKKRIRPPFEAKLVWSIFSIICIATIVGGATS